MKSQYYLLLAIVVIFLFATPLILFPSAQFAGTDSSAEQSISDQGYKPWFSPIWEPPSGEIETLLFSLQAALGAIIIGYFIGYERGKRAKTEPKADPSSSTKIG